MKMSVLDHETHGAEDRQRLAELLADGAKRADIADVFGVHVDTVSEWRKRSDIKALVSKIIEDRADRILSHTDTKILKMLESEKKIPLETLLKIRTAFAGEKLNVKVGADQEEALRALMEALHGS